MCIRTCVYMYIPLTRSRSRTFSSTLKSPLVFTFSYYRPTPKGNHYSDLYQHKLILSVFDFSFEQNHTVFPFCVQFGFLLGSFVVVVVVAAHLYTVRFSSVTLFLLRRNILLYVYTTIYSSYH